jgi:hypothetical protein
MPFAVYADIEHALDQTIVAQLCGDAGSEVTGPNAITDAALGRSEAIIKAYCRVGNIYTDAELDALAAEHNPLLIALAVDLATEFLFQRRGAKISPAIEQRIKQAYSYLEGLRDGKMLFGSVATAANADAGTPTVVAVPLSNLAYYNEASNSVFFPPRKSWTVP